ncbi:MAG: monovalent cation/H+ antiporter complex subunit F [Bacillota bacterium]
MDLFHTVLWITLVGQVVALGMAGYRALRGPTVADRVTALDAVGTIIIAILIVGAMLLEDRQYLAYALVLSVLSYVSTVAFAKYILRGVVIERDSD